MSDLKKEVEKEIRSWYEYYEGQLVKVKESEESMKELVSMIEEIELPKTSLSYNSIEVTFPSVEEARKGLSQILEKTSIEKFIKISKQRAEKLDWGYYVEHGKTSLTIYPAEPNKDCVAVKKTNTYTSWVCEKRGEEAK